MRCLIRWVGGSGGFRIVPCIALSGEVGREFADSVKQESAEDTVQHSLTSSVITLSSLNLLGEDKTLSPPHCLSMISSRPAISSKILSTFADNSSVAFFSCNESVAVL